MSEMGFKNKMNHQKYYYSFAVSGGAVGTLSLSALVSRSLPLNSVIASMIIKPTADFTSGGAATVSVGNTASATAYMAATAVASLTDNALPTVTGVPNSIGAANEQDVTMSIAVAALTAGSLEIDVEFYPEGT